MTHLRLNRSFWVKTKQQQNATTNNALFSIRKLLVHGRRQLVSAAHVWLETEGDLVEPRQVFLNRSENITSTTTSLYIK